jgi:hypothetical protein
MFGYLIWFIALGWTEVRELEEAIRAYLEHHNRHPKPFIWTKNPRLGRPIL